MTEIPRFVSYQLGRLIPFQSLFQISTPFFLPFYHVVSNQKIPHILNYKYRNIAQFEKELDFYLHHFKPVSLSELVAGGKPGGKIFHLSFDDGLTECFDIIAPILVKKGIPATFFVNPGFIDNQRLFHKYKASLVLSKLKKLPQKNVEDFLKEKNLDGPRILKATAQQEKYLDEAATLLGINFDDYLRKQKPYLTTWQLLKLKEQGFAIGAHSFTHPEFWNISEEEQLNEITKSMDWLVGKVNPEIKAFSFPFTDSGVSRKVMKEVKETAVCDVTFGTAGIKYDDTYCHFQRYPVEKDGSFELNLKAELVYLALRKLVGKATVKH